MRNSLTNYVATYQSAFAFWIAQTLGTLPRPAVEVTVEPFKNQIPTLPLVSRHRMSDMPSPLKSPVSATLQALGTLPRPAIAEIVEPFMNQIPTPPEVSRHKMALLPSPLKSPVPTTVQLVDAVATTVDVRTVEWF